ncbi:probably inactive leucine-rich repeat receptor-like protein kinase At5g06940 [Oryza brachyantha]|uniref:probably inactive leucine-rich repeat receptor-like protein kinase At5g06940 n=1 Tax=Oryza brachyantha TaxID=4533 RepID=UPI001ADACC46|nr:probably inactive leucine-rich repeat receptor-like protein kinase At5g06940 [Oryza brachyantha]
MATTAAAAVLFFSVVLILASPLVAASASAAGQAQELLLSFRASLKDTSGALSTWSPSTPYCNWSHITCTGGGAVSVALSLQGLGLSGDIAAEPLCRVPGLVALSLASNSFNQTVPLQLSRCASLVSLNLSSAAFWGPLPDQLAMLASLTSLDLSGNDIEGQVPPGLAALRGLEVLDLGGNRLSGVLHPALFRNLTRLHFLDLSNNQFLESELPPELGEMGGLRWLFLQGSGFTSAIPETLLQLEQLEFLDLSMNGLTGALPPAFGHNFRKLLSLDLSQNGFSGPFPKEIDKCVMLQRFQVQGNGFTGELPAGLWSLPDLRVIRAENNRFSGRLPELPTGVSRLEQVQVDNNSFSGGIPQSIGLVRTMYRFSASLNQLNGSLPDSLCDSPAMSIINVSRNSLSGAIPEFRNCKRLVSLSLSGNALTGSIPASLGGLPVLTYIDVSSNGLTGAIPAELQSLKLALLNVSYNHLTGRVPPSLVSGALPAVFLEGNPGLCGAGLRNDGCDAPPLRNHQGLALAATVAALATGVTLLAVGALAVCRRLHGDTSSSSSSSNSKLVLFHPIKITGDELLAALRRDKNVIGRGPFGETYLIELQDGQRVAVKRLISSGKQTFRAVKNEMKILAKIRHRNIAKMLGFCYRHADGEVSVIHEHLRMGSLHDLIRAPKFTLGWNDRLRIAIGVAQGLVYLHHDYAPRLLHRDLKSSNVLLGDELEPKVTGFGVDRVVGEEAYRASLRSDLNYGCYIAPEVSCTKKPTHLMDVYSFGVILLELITGRPAEQPASDGSVDIVRWVWRRANVADGAAQILDAGISRTAQQGMRAALELALRCTSVMPDQRPAMDEVVRSLQLLYPPHPSPSPAPFTGVALGP